MVDLNVSALSVLGGLLIANFGVLVGAYVSLRVGQAVSDVKVGRLEQDVKNLATMINKKGEK